MTARDFVDQLAARGRYTFTTEAAQAALGGSLPAVRAALRRLKSRGQIADPYRGFHVIVPPEYRRVACLPPEQFVPQLMQWLGETYYVALLSAADLHGAAHQRPQRFQVMVAGNRRSLTCGEVHVDFIARRDLARTPVVLRNTPRGTLRVASPEATALELIGYADRCGGLGNVLAVLAELSERIEPAALLEAARLCPVAWAQRLGYLLERAGWDDLAKPLADVVRETPGTVAPLVRSRPMKAAPRAARWRLALNVDLDLEP